MWPRPCVRTYSSAAIVATTLAIKGPPHQGVFKRREFRRHSQGHMRINIQSNVNVSTGGIPSVNRSTRGERGILAYNNYWTIASAISQYGCTSTDYVHGCWTSCKRLCKIVFKTVPKYSPCLQRYIHPLLRLPWPRGTSLPNSKARLENFLSVF